jgi:subtilisin family serine protease
MARVQVQFGGRGGAVFDLETNEDLVAIRTRDRAPVEDAPLSGASRRLLDGLETVTRFHDAGVEVFHVRSGTRTLRDEVCAAFAQEPAITFAGRVLADPVFRPETPLRAVVPGAPKTKEPVLYSENVFVKFASTTSGTSARRVLAAAGLRIKRRIEYVDNAYFVAAPPGTGLRVFEIALTLLRDTKTVELCHPEILRPRELRGAFPQQWHLQAARVSSVRIDAHASVVKAWKVSQGQSTAIAIIDTGIDIDHAEFSSARKIVAPRDATAGALDPKDPRPRSTAYEKHGTACAGVACANGANGASGVAPAARLVPIRLMSGLGSQSEADAFAWAADHGADVISCSWGPTDGDWWDEEDPGHRATIPLPDNTRLAIEYALTSGRSGKGCVICWAAGNGNESVDNDGYASHPGVIAVAACNDSGTRSVYSDTGKALWCSFPSNDNRLDAVTTMPKPLPVGGVWDVNHPAPKTRGIWTTDWSGANGYNRGGTTAGGDAAGNYTNSFGGTSSAAPGVAGVAALILSVNKHLRHEEVRDILKRSCDRIDTARGAYDAAGHSLLYGYGRVNAAKAVALAAKERNKRKRSQGSAVKRRRKKSRSA